MVNVVKNINWRVCFITYHFDWFNIQQQYEESTKYIQLKTADLL